MTRIPNFRRVPRPAWQCCARPDFSNAGELRLRTRVLDLPAPTGGGGPTSWGGITGTLSAQTDLQAALDAAAAAAAWGSITGTLSAQTDLQAALDLKAPLNDPTFTGDAVFDNAGSPNPPLLPESYTRKVDVDGYLLAFIAVLNTLYAAINAAVTSFTMSTGGLLGRSTAGTGAVEEIVVGSGLSLSGGTLIATSVLPVIGKGLDLTGDTLENIDGWTYVKLASDFPVSVTANTSVTGLAFTPAANEVYEIEGLFLLRTAAATTGPRPGVSWPSAGVNDSASSLDAPNSNTAQALRLQGARTTQNAASTGLPTTTDSYLSELKALLVMGASPTGDFAITLASEVAASTVTMRAGSFIRWRILP